MGAMQKAIRSFFLVIAAGLALPAAAQSATMLTPAPRYMEPVYVRVSTPPRGSIYITQVDVSMNGTAIHVFVGTSVEIASGGARDVLLGRFPAGSFTVNVRWWTGETNGLRFAVAPLPAPTVEAPPLPIDDATGLWFNPEEPGWGLSVAQGPTGQFFLVWFVYDDANRPVWYTIQGGRWMGWGYQAPIVRTQGPPLGPTFDSSSVVERQVGEAIFMFGGQVGQLVYRFGDGPYISKHLVRQPIE